MSIFTDITLLVDALKAVDAFLGTIPQNAEVTLVKAKLDEALNVVSALGL